MTTLLPSEVEQSGLPSRTSILVAAARAFGSREPDESVRNPDYLADCLLTDTELDLIKEHPLAQAMRRDYLQGTEDPTVMPMVWLMLLRTRFIEAKLRTAVASGVRQLVILGAGFDTRAYRLQDLLQSCKVVEADARTTQQYKQRRIRACVATLPPNLTYLPLDFPVDDLGAVLEGCGLTPNEKTFWILEGVLMYLNEKVAEQTLKQIAAFSAPGSALVLDYSNQTGLEALQAAAHQTSLNLFAQWGEPWLFGVPGDGTEYFSGCGFIPATAAMNDAEMIKAYTTRTDGTVYGAAAFQKMREQAQYLSPQELEKRVAAAAAYRMGELVVPLR